MIYHKLLYSRSLSRDYRWMIVPPKVSTDSLRVLNQLYNLYDREKGIFNKSPVSPLYCLNLSDRTFLVSCGLSDHKDKDGRGIYYLQGISVERKYRKHFWFMLSWILVHYTSENFLDSTGIIDSASADDIVRLPSQDYVFNPGMVNKPVASLTDSPCDAPEGFQKLFKGGKVYVSFDKKGLNELSDFILSYHGCVDFAFGATYNMVKSFDFKIIARAGRHPGKKSSADNMLRDTASLSPVSESTEDLPEELDPIGRFNPRKEDVRNSRKGRLKRNNPSKIIGQILPRFLSIFRPGRKRGRK